MNVWDALCVNRSISRIENLNPETMLGEMWPLMKPQTYFMASFEGRLEKRGVVSRFEVEMAPANSAWRVLVNGEAADVNSGRVGMSGVSADGGKYGVGKPYLPRPSFRSPASLAVYSNFPIWGSRLSRYSSDFMPSEAWLGNERFMRVLCRPDPSRENEESRAEIVIDLLHRFAVGYKITHGSRVGIGMSVERAVFTPEPDAAEIEEVYASPL